MNRRSGTVASLAALASIVLAPARPALAESDPASASASASAPVVEASPASADATHSTHSTHAAHASSAIDAIFVADALVAAGTSPEVAIAQVAALTPEDLSVLAGHPAMVQVAGSNAALTRNLVIGLVVLGAIIALAAASDGGGAVVTN